MSDEIMTIMLEDEEGNTSEFEVVDMILYENKCYVCLIPCEESDEIDEVVILEQNGQEDEYVSVEDEDILDKVFELFKKRNADEFNFVD